MLAIFHMFLSSAMRQFFFILLLLLLLLLFFLLAHCILSVSRWNCVLFGLVYVYVAVN